MKWMAGIREFPKEELAQFIELAQKTGLINEINQNVNINVLKRHLPYHESDHVLNIAYNHIAGGTCLEDIDLLRNNEAWLDALKAEIIPD